MQKIILYTLIVLLSFITNLNAQETDSTKVQKETFEQRARKIANKIEFVTKSEKQALKEKVEAIDLQLEKGQISKEEASRLKQEEAQKSAIKIDTAIANYNDELQELIQQKVNGEVASVEGIEQKGGTMIAIGGSGNDSIGKNRTEINIGSLKVYHGEDDKKRRLSKRTTSQFVFAFGLNNIITENESLNESDYKVWGSHFYEWGLTLNSRIFKNHNLLHAKYGLSLMYNNLRPTDNRYFVKNGDLTELQDGFTNFNESRFRNVYLTAPVHLEFDFTPKKTDKDGNSYFRTHQSFRLAIGGYAGVRIKSKQILKYEEDDQKVKVKQKGDFNVNDFNYGLSAYVGYGQLSLYAKYDINPLFKDNPIEQNNISLGLRFDFN
ncbi:hypothetical protein [Flavobacterium haoranii]|uniref:Outer membrane protein beta-barrel domain-containing protein n=2 Tax=Flavobacterium haoranii TaxID=683124 RepID=A0A1M6D689_9FLAO|nr:hypothetical protein [Flavobacterium haoranii]SHI68765.1 hypothetical protein SAMN05444337_0557 [Flavobacterium haoranii]